MPRGDNNRKLSDAARDEIIRLYTTPRDDGGWTGTPTIARQFGVSDSAIRGVLNSAGMALRSASEAQNPGLTREPRGPYAVDGKFTHQERVAARSEERPTCQCGCGQLVSWDPGRNRWRRYVDRSHYRPHAIYKDETWLRQQYIAERKSARTIAAECGVVETAIRKYMAKFGIEARDSSESKRGINAGERNPAWKGGITPLRQRLYKTTRWIKIRSYILDRDGHACQRCGDGENLVVHHIWPWAIFQDRRFHPGGLITLCKPCHTWVHSRANVNRDFLRS